MIPASTGRGRRLRRLLHPLVTQAGATPGADRYRKHFPATAHLWLLLLRVLLGGESLRQSHATLATLPGVFRRLGLPQGISRSQLTRAATSRDPTCAGRLFAAVVARVRPVAQRDPAWRALTRMQAADSAFLRLVARLSPWSRHGGHAPGVRVHVGLDLAGAIPTQLRLTGTETHDAAAFDGRDLTALAGWTVVGDLGYYGHARNRAKRASPGSVRCMPRPAITSPPRRRWTRRRRPPGMWWRPIRPLPWAVPTIGRARSCPACAWSPARPPPATCGASSPIATT
jgi:hypothetical protein